MADVLFHTDSYLKEFNATVTGMRGREIALDRTAFYPGGGGQPHDLGKILAGDRVWEVKKIGKDKNDGEIWHEVEGDPPPIGAQIRGWIDWERRYRLMRTHTALHILCGVIFRDYRSPVTGGNMEPLQGRLDFEFESMRQELVKEIEEKINREVTAARPVRVQILPREAAFQIPDLIRTKINLLPPGIAEVRTVEIEGLDLQADGGTHVANTSEVGPLRIVDYKSKGRINKRLVVALQE